jgi:serine/threonine-protein phosphatase 6 regulatory subunit 3
MHSSADQFNSSDDDDDDDEGGWLSQSTFGLRDPPVSTMHQSSGRRPLSASGFEVRLPDRPSLKPSYLMECSQDSFAPSSTSNRDPDDVHVSPPYLSRIIAHRLHKL